MTSRVEQYVGNGLYTVEEAALFARVSTAMMSRWLFGTRSGKPVVRPQFGRGDKLVSFLDLIQTLAIREIRLQHRVPLAKFRQAIDEAERRRLTYPFARSHCTYLKPDGELVIRTDPYADSFVEASGKHRGQRLIPFVEMYLKDLTYDAAGLAKDFRIFRYGNVSVTMDPDRRFGEPLLPSGHSAVTIRRAVTAEGGLERAAKAYGIPLAEVETAYHFYDFLNANAA
jgi:hypothetical protein